jgi:predicted TIM-barrel fold metal-dependent hydrolase
MDHDLSRRVFLGSGLSASAVSATPRPAGLLIDTHIHLFAGDQRAFPYHPNATYQPPPQPLEPYLRFVQASGIDHVIIVHPEPYQDDHRYLEFCFAHEPAAGFFKGTCLFDPIAPDTPARMEALTRQHPGRIVALRIHEMRQPGKPPTRTGPIKDRDLRDPAMKVTWRKARGLGLAIQMHFLPYYSPQIGELAAQFPEMPVILDHLGRAGQGSAADQKELFRLGRIPSVVMKYSALNYSSKAKFPYPDAKPLVRRAFDAFGPDRMIWGGLGHTMEEFEQQARLFEIMFDFARPADRAKIRGGNAARLFGFRA